MKELFITGLFLVSVLTTATVQAIKNMLGEKPYNSNLLAAIVSTILSICVAVFYVLYNGVAISIQIILATIAFAFFSWLASQVGYDKIKELLSHYVKKEE